MDKISSVSQYSVKSWYAKLNFVTQRVLYFETAAVTIVCLKTPKYKLPSFFGEEVIETETRIVPKKVSIRNVNTAYLVIVYYIFWNVS